MTDRSWLSLLAAALRAEKCRVVETTGGLWVSWASASDPTPRLSVSWRDYPRAGTMVVILPAGMPRADGWVEGGRPVRLRPHLGRVVAVVLTRLRQLAALDAVVAEAAAARERPRQEETMELTLPHATDEAVEIGRRLARMVFARRGNRTEVHLNEAELAALLALAAAKGQTP